LIFAVFQPESQPDTDWYLSIRSWSWIWVTLLTDLYKLVKLLLLAFIRVGLIVRGIP
jgi:hypothetical protein